MRLAVALFLAGLVGCSNRPASIVPVGPVAEDQEAALKITWDGVYKMEMALRPSSITWWPPDGCHEETAFTGTIDNLCAADSEGSRGDVYIRWQGTISASNFSRALVMWRQYLLTGTMTRPSPEELQLTELSNLKLEEVGL